MVSVCLATYNGEVFIKEQIDSILSQLGKDDELIISDDGSTDKTINIILKYNDSRIKIYQNNGIHGVNVNFSNALKHAQGDFIFLSDQDDVWLPDKISICCNVLKKYYCVVHDAIVVDKNLNIISESLINDYHSSSGFLKNLIKNSYIGCCMAFRKEILDFILPIPQTKAFYHDWWIGGIADIKYKVKFINYKGILFRRHLNNSSCTANKSKFSRIRQLINRLYQAKFLFIRVVLRKI